MIKTKKCKAETKAKGYDSCGKDTDVKYRKFGLCPSCFWDWMHTDENGKIHYQKQFLPKTKKVFERNLKEIEKEKKIKIITPDKYRSKYLQPEINKAARLIDYGQSCIATDNFGKMNGGHYRSVGSNRTIALNLHNIHIQSFESNTFRGGDDKNYKDGLIDRYGIKYFEFVDSLRQHRVLKLTVDEMIAIRKKIMTINIDLERDKKILQPKERIYLRNMINIELGIYDKEYQSFSIKID